MQMQRYLKETENYDKMIKRKIGGRKFSRKIIPKLCEAFAVASKNPDTSKFFQIIHMYYLRKGAGNEI